MNNVGTSTAPTAAECESAMQILETHNNQVRADRESRQEKDPNGVKFDSSIEYWVDVTGRRRAFFTFWRVKHPVPDVPVGPWNNMEPVYMGNLAIDLNDACLKAVQKIQPRFEIFLNTTQNLHSMVGKNRNKDKFTFGKYRGEKYVDVFQKDPNYFMWLYKSRDPNYDHTIGAQAIAFFAEAAKEQIVERNRETSTAQWLGQPGMQVKAELTIYKIAGPYMTSFGPGKTIYYTLADGDGNKFKAKNLHKKFPQLLNSEGVAELVEGKNDVIKVKAKISNHYEAMGIKFNDLIGVQPWDGVDKKTRRRKNMGTNNTNTEQTVEQTVAPKAKKKAAAKKKVRGGADEATLKSVKEFVQGLIADNDGNAVLKRATIYKGAVEAGFENKVIYRYMLHPSFKAADRGTYNASLALGDEG